jgi:leader peptidase (prepilin peptidase)/N-methyltransferase
MPLLFTLSLAGVVGLLVGSFLATLVLRLPKREPVVFDRSACPQCGHILGPTELVPVLSWLIQRQRCRACGGRIPAFYPLMEIASSAIAVAAVFWTPWPVFVAMCVVGWIGLCVVAWAARRWMSG